MASTLSLTGIEQMLSTLGVDGAVPAFPASDVLARPMDIYRCFLAELLSKIVPCDAQTAYEALLSPNETTNDDLAVVLPRLKQHGRDNKKLGFEIVDKFPKPGSSPLFVLPTIDGVQLRVWCQARTRPHIVLPYIFDRKAGYGADPRHGARGTTNDNGSDPSGARKRVVVEFSSPNIANEFHAKHLRSTVLGAHVARAYDNMGWDVVRLNYLGDWGKQIGLLEAGWRRYGDEDALAANPLRHLLHVFKRAEDLFRPEVEEYRRLRDEGKSTADVEAQGLYYERDAFFKKLEDRDADALDLWRRFRDTSINAYRELYARLGINFDEYSGESTVRPETIERVEAALRDKGVYEETKDAWTVDFTKHGAPKLGSEVVRYRSGTTSYLLRDVAAALDRAEKFSFDKLVYVVTSEQERHFLQVFKLLELMGEEDLVGKLSHLGFGRVQEVPVEATDDERVPRGMLLSTILSHCRESALSSLRKDEESFAMIPDPSAVADIMGTTALAIQDLSVKRGASYTFDMTKSIDFGHDTGFSLQKWHSRLVSVIRDAEYDGSKHPRDTDLAPLEDEGYEDLLRLLAQYPDIVSASFKNLEPATVTAYLFRVTAELATYFPDEEDEAADSQDEEDEGAPETSEAEILLYDCVRQVLENGMKLLGLRLLI